MIKSWKAQLVNGTKVAIIDLSKAFNSLNHDLLYLSLTKLKSYGLDNNSVQFFRSFFAAIFLTDINVKK